MQAFRWCSWRTIPTTFNAVRLRHNSISALQAAFRDPSSPFHIPPGTEGPASPDPPSQTEDVVDPLEEAHQKLTEAGFDPASFWEQRIAWGDQDPFQHVNNVRYIRFFESSRIKWMMSLGHELGGPSKAEAMIRGQGISLILKSIDVRFRRPVTYPDTLLVGYKPKQPPPSAENNDPATFNVTASAYSLAQRAFVATSNEALVWYDYDKLKKCDPGEEVRSVVWRRGSKA
ncbi:putative thioesterase-like superfamily protein [Lyophyllum shimeji]|uniref:Thioesterase-like superfamily protein n=1 Tax=Lyophyllum shimeji TaxID=47721 RepID=A0A9P3PUJ0_LYOSH|nr:putative thioesterase-like superfamily protein [Lyophyllum shimeji]